MSEQEIVRILAKARFKFRSDTSINWEMENPILLDGEFGVVTGLNEVGDGEENKTQKVKIGDGIHAWNELDWWYGPEGNGGSVNVDQTYNPESENPQSGKALKPVFENRLEAYIPGNTYYSKQWVVTTVNMPIDGTSQTCSIVVKCKKDHTAPDDIYNTDNDDFKENFYSDTIYPIYAEEAVKAQVADKAWYDGNGNAIHTTYATKKELENIGSGGGGTVDLSNYYTKEEVDEIIGDIETSLDNIITKYGLGGETV